MARPNGSIGYQKVIINHAKIASSLTHFEYFVNLSSLSSMWWDNLTGRADIVVYDPVVGAVCPSYMSPSFSIVGKIGTLYFDVAVSSTYDKTVEIHIVPGGSTTNLSTVFTNNNAINAMSMSQTSDGETDMAGRYNGTAAGVVAYSQTGQVGKCLQFNAASGIRIGSVTEFLNCTNFTISFLAKQTAQSATNDLFIGLYSSKWLRIQTTSTDTIFINLQDGTGKTGTLSSMSTYWPLNSWAHIVWTYDGAGATDADKCKLYINGQLMTLTFAGTFPSTFITSTPVFDWGRQGAYGMIGYMDDARIYTDTKDSGWVTSTYNSIFDTAFATYASYVISTMPITRIHALGQSNMVGQDTTHGYSSYPGISYYFFSNAYWRNRTIDPIQTGATIWPKAIEQILSTYPSTTVGIIPSAVGGKGLFDTWAVRTSAEYLAAVAREIACGWATFRVYYGSENDIGSARTKAQIKADFLTFKSNMEVDTGNPCRWFLVVPYVGTSSAAANNACKDAFEELATENADIDVVGYAQDYQTLIDTIHLSKSAMDSLGDTVGTALKSLYTFSQIPNPTTWNSANFSKGLFPYIMYGLNDMSSGTFPGVNCSATLQNGATYSTASRAILFDASDDYLATTINLPFSTTAKWAVSMWFQVKDITSAAKAFICQYDDTNNRYVLYRSFGDLNFNLSIGGTNQVTTHVNAIWAAGLFNLVLRYNYNDNLKFEMLINGTNNSYSAQPVYSLGTKTFTGNMCTNAYQNGAAWRNDDSLYALEYYSGALSDADIVKNYFAGLNFFGLRSINNGNGTATLKKLISGTGATPFQKGPFYTGPFRRPSFR